MRIEGGRVTGTVDEETVLRIARARNEANQRAGRVGRNDGYASPEAPHVTGVATELAFARWQGLGDDAVRVLADGTDPGWDFGDVREFGRVDVKGTNGTHRVLLYPIDRWPPREEPDTFVLGWVTGPRTGRYTVCFVGHISRELWLTVRVRDDELQRPAWSVPWSWLRPATDLAPQPLATAQPDRQGGTGHERRGRPVGWSG